VINPHGLRRYKRGSLIAVARRFIAHFHDRLKKSLDTTDTAVLQSQFLLEEKLDELLMDLALQPNQLNLDVQFAVKVKILRAFAPLGNDERWKVIEAINKLRNSSAHGGGRDEKQKAIHKLRNLWKAQVEKEDPFIEMDWPDYNVVLGATVESLRFLAAVEEEIKKASLGHAAEVRKLLRQLDEQRPGA